MTHVGPVLDAVDGYEVVECRGCGFRHVVPLPEPATLEDEYRRRYYSHEKPDYLARVAEDRDWWRLVDDERLEMLEALAPGRRLLDVGSGPGHFLIRARERGWLALGLEPSAQAAEHSRRLGLDVVEGVLDDASARRLDRFDAVHLSEVLEHVPDPAATLRLVHRLLDPGGVVCVVVPNDYNPVQEALRSRGYDPWWVAPPHHLNYFDFDSLERLLVRCGFAPELREATFPIDAFLLLGDDYVGDDVLGRACHGRRMALERVLEQTGLRDAKRDLYRALAARGLGREALVVARRVNDV